MPLPPSTGYSLSIGMLTFSLLFPVFFFFFQQLALFPEKIEKFDFNGTKDMCGRLTTSVTQ